jgi:DNA-binding IclR family transcriptional regulator
VPKPTPPATRAREPQSRGIQSIEVGGRLLQALAHEGSPLALKDLAQAAGMSPGKAHPYLVSFIRLGLVERETEGGRYGLGPLALRMGLIGLQQYDPVRLATPLIDELAAATGHTVAIAVWGHRGPTLVRIAEAPSPVHVSMRHGTVMSIPDTASGRLFAAFGPADAVRAALAAEPPRARPRSGGRHGRGARGRRGHDRRRGGAGPGRRRGAGVRRPRPPGAGTHGDRAERDLRCRGGGRRLAPGRLGVVAPARLDGPGPPTFRGSRPLERGAATPARQHALRIDPP